MVFPSLVLMGLKRTICIRNFTERNLGLRVIWGNLTLNLIRLVSIFTIELCRTVALCLAGVLLQFVPRDFITPATILCFPLSAVGAKIVILARGELVYLQPEY